MSGERNTELRALLSTLLAPGRDELLATWSLRRLPGGTPYLREDADTLLPGEAILVNGLGYPEAEAALFQSLALEA